MPPSLIVLLFGLVIGSFLNVCIYRLPRNQSLILPSSRCPACNTPIGVLDNIPVVSFLILGGKCRSCGKRISLRYPLVEALNALLYLAVIERYGLGWDAGFYCLLVSSLIVITFVDLDFQIIPDRITLMGIPVGLLAGSFILPDPFSRTSALGFKASLIGGASGFILYYLIAYLSIVIVKKEGMGGGDIKLMAMVGAFLGWKAVILTTFLGSVFGSIVGIAIMIQRGKAGSVQIPFGPYLALGTIISLFFGQEILTWYLH